MFVRMSSGSLQWGLRVPKILQVIWSSKLCTKLSNFQIFEISFIHPVCMGHLWWKEISFVSWQKRHFLSPISQNWVGFSDWISLFRLPRGFHIDIISAKSSMFYVFILKSTMKWSWFLLDFTLEKMVEDFNMWKNDDVHVCCCEKRSSVALSTHVCIYHCAHFTKLLYSSCTHVNIHIYLYDYWTRISWIRLKVYIYMYRVI